MARNIYSFVKIEKRQTKRGILAAALGCIAIGCILILVLASFIRGGTLPPAAGAVGYLSFIAAGIGLWLSVKLRKDSEAYGTMVHGALYVNSIAVALHVLIFILGFLSIVM